MIPVFAPETHADHPQDKIRVLQPVTFKADVKSIGGDEILAPNPEIAGLHLFPGRGPAFSFLIRDGQRNELEGSITASGQGEQEPKRLWPAIDRQRLAEYALCWFPSDIATSACDKPAFFRQRQMTGNEVRQKAAVSVDEDEVFPTRDTYRTVPAAAEPVAIIVLPEVFDGQTAFLPKAIDEIFCLLPGAVVRDYDLEIPGILQTQRVQDHRQRFRPVVGRKND